MALIFIISAFPCSLCASELENKREVWLSLSNELQILQSNQSSDLATLKRKNELLNTEYKAKSEYLRVLALEFLNGNIQKEDLDRDFKNLANYSKIMNQFSIELLLSSIDRLRKSQINEIKEFIKRYDQVYEKNAIPIFRLSGTEIKRGSPTEEKGGFHRGTSSLFMDITRTSSEEWIFILMHELFHALDADLQQATITFSNKDLMSAVLSISKNKLNFVELNSKEVQLLDKWILAGLDRGLFAEYRDWSFGFSVYEKGKQEGLWGKILFIEQALSFKDKNEDMNSFVYRYLNERVKDSTDEILNRPIIKERTLEQRDLFKP